MSNTKFTLGSWKFIQESRGDWLLTMGETKGPADNWAMGNPCYDQFTPDNIYDWHLIASAPDLYEALEEAVEMLEGMLASFNVEGADMYVGSDDIDVMKAALAKARGES